jgi:hypothetical protein
MTNRNLTLEEVRVKYDIWLHPFRVHFIWMRPFTVKRNISLWNDIIKIKVEPLKVIKKYWPNGMVYDVPEQLNKTKYSLLDLSKIWLWSCNS